MQARDIYIYLMKHSTKFICLLVLILSFTIPFIPGVDARLIEVLIIMYVFIMFSSAWNLLAYSGQASLGHSAFLGLGAYTSVIIAKMFNLNPLITVIIGGLFTAIIGLLIGLTCVRLREWFLAMVTFGFAIIIHTITVELSGITGGHDGLPTKHLVSASVLTITRYRNEYYIILIFTILSIYIINTVIKSKIGLAFEAIRENELEAKVMGIDTTKYKLIGFALSAFFSGIAGALMIHHIGYLTPDIYSIENSFRPIIYCISGGLFTIEGPIIGTFIITVIWDGLKYFGLIYEHLVIIGLLLILIVIFLPRGFISIFEDINKRFRSVTYQDTTS